MTLTYRAKKHEKGARDFAVYDDGTYLGDAIAVFEIPGQPGRFARKHEAITILHVPLWQAQPAGESHPLSGDDSPEHVRFRFETRGDAAKALRLRRLGWTANEIVGAEPPPVLLPLLT